MKDKVAPQIFEKYPDYIRGVVVAKNINNHGEIEQLTSSLRDIQESTRKKLLPQDRASHPRIANWREAYKKFGVNPKEFPPSIESLCKRVLNGKTILYINTVVALFNYFSLKNFVPSGADNLDNVKGDLCLKISNGNEIFIPFNSNEIEHPLNGEVVYTDDERVLCRCWNWRQGNQTKITPDTRNIAINIDCLLPVNHEEADRITRELAELVKRYCSEDVKYYLLHSRQQEIEI